MSTSRLDRLLTLLESGSSDSIRKAAAIQIGEIQKAHPSELHTLLPKLQTRLLSKQWDTRVAAAHALDATLRNVTVNISSGDCNTLPDPIDTKLCFGQFSLTDFMRANEHHELVAGGKVTPPSSSSAGDIKKQKALLGENLGDFVDVDDLVDDQDLISAMSPSTTTTTTPTPPTNKRSLKSAKTPHLKKQKEEAATPVSARQEMLAHRKAHKQQQQQSTEAEMTPEPTATATTPTTTEMTITEQPQQDNKIVMETVNAAAATQSSRWPFRSLSGVLCRELMSPLWENRHGAAMGLRELIKHHGTTAGKDCSNDPAIQTADNLRWLEDFAVRLLQVLCLDRFTDYSSDTPVAPVRETCAQVIGVLCRGTSASSSHFVTRLIELLLSLRANEKHWEVRQAGLLGFKYVLAVRPELGSLVIPMILDSLIEGIGNQADEDVCGACASALLPVAQTITTIPNVPRSAIERLVVALWTALSDFDEQTATASPIMELLASLHSSLNSNDSFINPVVCVTRLLPHLHHTSSSVRASALRTLRRLIQTKHSNAADLWNPQDILPSMLSHLLVAIVIDSVMEDLAQSTWTALISVCPPDKLSVACFGLLQKWINCIRSPSFIGQRTTSPSLINLPKIDQLLTENVNDEELMSHIAKTTTNNNTASTTQIDAFLCGVRAIGQVIARFPADYRAALFGMLEGLFNFQSTTSIPSITAALIAQQWGLSSSSTTANQFPTHFAAQIDSKLTQQQTPPPTTTTVNTRVTASLACCLACWDPPPLKLNSVLHSLLSSVKSEENVRFQQFSAMAIAKLMQLTTSRKVNPNAKLVSNIAALLLEYSSSEVACRGGEATVKFLCEMLQDKLFEKIPRILSIMSDQLLSSLSTSTTTIQSSLVIYSSIIKYLHPALLPKLIDFLPKLAEATTVHEDNQTTELASKAISTSCKQPLLLNSTMRCVILNILPFLRPCADSSQKCRAARAINDIITTLDVKIVPYSFFLLGPLLGCMSDQDQAVRESVAFSFGSLVRLMPLETTNTTATTTATTTTSEFGDLPVELLEQRDREKRFLGQLLDGKRLDTYKLPFAIQNFALRKYQQEGINWLAFLHKYRLHGALTDEMGLGKTVQALCVVAASAMDQTDEASRTLPSLIVCPPTLVGHWKNEVKRFIDDEKVLTAITYTGSPSERERIVREQLGPRKLLIASYDVVRNDAEALLSDVKFNYLVLDEGHVIKNPKAKLTVAVKKLKALSRLVLTGTPIQNNVLELWSLFDFLMPGFLGSEKSFNDRFSKPILAARNATVSLSIPSTLSQTEQQQQQSGGAGGKEQEAGALAMEALRKQVQPFILRRVKEDVLSDLPPKIIQDYYVDLTPLQLRLYQDFIQKSGSVLNPADEQQQQQPQTINGVTSTTTTETAKKPEYDSMFKALQYLRKVCDHPALVLEPGSSNTSNIDLKDIKHSSKLMALKDLLHQCGIGMAKKQQQQQQQSSPQPGAEPSSNGATAQHRVLVFAQLKSMLDIVEKDLFTAHMPDVTFLRLDGTVPAQKRQEVVEHFNADPTIDVLLLTTHVGGLGLNLTAADVVIFLEHDWNPSRDLQAMDRAHRLGQTKVVNVYRLITKGTLEEKIMGLQRFKTHLANTVVSKESETSLLSTVDTSQLLDLFSLSGPQQSPPPAAAAGGSSSSATTTTTEANKGIGKKLAAVLDQMGELWDETQYTEEFDIDGFVKKL